MPLSQPIVSLEEALVVWDSVLAENEPALGYQQGLDVRENALATTGGGHPQACMTAKGT